jgi:hypothetical protein
MFLYNSQAEAANKIIWEKREPRANTHMRIRTPTQSGFRHENIVLWRKHGLIRMRPGRGNLNGRQQAALPGEQRLAGGRH